MPNYEEVSRTKDFHQTRLLHDHPEIVSIAPMPKLNDQGLPTDEAVIVIGIKKMDRPPLTPTSQTQAAAIPKKLPLIALNGVEDKSQSVDVIVEEEGEIAPEESTGRRRPCPGGYSISHPRVMAGTLGGVVRIDGDWGYILSNNHVLRANDSKTVGDNICQPGISDGGGAKDVIGRVHRWVPIRSGSCHNEVDCAVAKALDPWQVYVTREVYGIGVPAKVEDAHVTQTVRKSGKKTELTEGTICSDNATVRFSFGGEDVVFINQLKYTSMTKNGDSGALVWDQNSLTVVGLHFAGSILYSYGNKITRVLELLSRAQVVDDNRRTPIRFSKVDISFFD